MEFEKIAKTILYASQQKRRRFKNRSLDSVGEGEGGMICEKSIETCILPYGKQMTRTSSVHEAEHSDLVLWDNPEGWGGEGDGWGFWIGGHTCTCG